MRDEREDILYNIYYSISYDAMNEIFYQRLDTCISLLTIILGTSVIGQFGFEAISGVVIVFISAIAIVIKPGEKAASFRASKRAYTKLSITPPEITKELAEAFAQLQLDDLEGVNAFRQAAYIRAGLITGRDVAEQKLSSFEYWMSKLGGEFLDQTSNK